MANIDCPEAGQPYGREAKAGLDGLLRGKTLTVTGSYTDRYGRLIGFVKADGIDVNRRMVQLDFAWDYPRYSKGQYAAEQREAKSARRRLWASSEAIPPWEWRR